MLEPTTFDIDRSQQRLGPIWLSPGISRLNFVALLYTSMMTIVFVTSLGLLMPYLLHEHLSIPTDVQGNFTGNLTVIAEIIAIAVVVPVGLLSDRIGWRSIFVTGFLLICISFILCPLARTPGALIAVRILVAAGISSCLMMLASVIADYPQNSSRGKLIGANGVVTGFGVVIFAALVFAQLPGIFSERGATPIEAGTYSYWIVAGAALLTALLARLGLKGGRATVHRERRPLAELLRTGIGEIRKNPRLGLTCAAYFVSRGDLAVFVFFCSLWIVAVGTDAGIPIAEAQATAGRLFGVSQLAMVLFTPVIGLIVDRFDRVTALAMAMAIATLGYVMLGTVGDPFTSPFIYPVAILAGALAMIGGQINGSFVTNIETGKLTDALFLAEANHGIDQRLGWAGEACIIVSGPALVGQEAPAKTRGSIIGVVGFFGALGVLIHSKISGMLFDDWMYQAPFIYLAFVNALVCVLAIAVRVIFGSSRGAGVSSVGEAVLD